MPYNELSAMNNGNEPKREHYPMFDVLRLVLALDVVLKHVTALGGMNQGAGFDFVLPAVPCFLALSGFMVLASRESSRSGLHFWQKRILRIGPAFVASLLLVVSLFGAAEIAKTLAAWWSLGAIETGCNGPLYSLSCEEILYMAMSVLWLLGAYRSKVLLWFLLGTSLLLMTGIHGLPSWLGRITPLPTCFLMGNLFYLYRDRSIGLSKWFAFFLLLAVLAQHFQSSLVLAYEARIILSCLTCLCLGTIVQGASWLKADISYGIYVYHWPVLIYLAPRGHGFLWVGTGLTVGIAFLSYYAIERPALRLKNWRSKPTKTPLPGGGGVEPTPREVPG